MSAAAIASLSLITIHARAVELIPFEELNFDSATLPTGWSGSSVIRGVPRPFASFGSGHLQLPNGVVSSTRVVSPKVMPAAWAEGWSVHWEAVAVRGTSSVVELPTNYGKVKIELFSSVSPMAGITYGEVTARIDFGTGPELYRTNAPWSPTYAYSLLLGDEKLTLDIRGTLGAGYEAGGLSIDLSGRQRAPSIDGSSFALGVGNNYLYTAYADSVSISRFSSQRPTSVQVTPVVDGNGKHRDLTFATKTPTGNVSTSAKGMANTGDKRLDLLLNLRNQELPLPPNSDRSRITGALGAQLVTNQLIDQNQSGDVQQWAATTQDLGNVVQLLAKQNVAGALATAQARASINVGAEGAEILAPYYSELRDLVDMYAGQNQLAPQRTSVPNLTTDSLLDYTVVSAYRHNAVDYGYSQLMNGGEVVDSFFAAVVGALQASGLAHETLQKYMMAISADNLPAAEMQLSAMGGFLSDADRMYAQAIGVRQALEGVIRPLYGDAWDQPTAGIGQEEVAQALRLEGLGTVYTEYLLQHGFTEAQIDAALAAALEGSSFAATACGSYECAIEASLQSPSDWFDSLFVALEASSPQALILAAVPEPATVTTLLVGLALLVVCVRRRGSLIDKRRSPH